MNYLSVCSGIEAATVAWEPLGFKPIGFSEIEEFPCAVLKHHYPEVKNLGDMTQFQGWNINEAIDILAGGTPCQSFSIAGLRKGLDDPRGNLCLTYIAIAAKFKPRWIVWENVPGVLSSNGGRDFGSFLGALEKCGYGWSYRVLDAQWFGLAQRRRRVFVVANFGSWQRSAAVLFERKSLQRDTPPSREAGQRVAATITRGFGDRGVDSDQIANGNYAIANCIQTTCAGSAGKRGKECLNGEGSSMRTSANHANVAGNSIASNANNITPIAIAQGQRKTSLNTELKKESYTQDSEAIKEIKKDIRHDYQLNRLVAFGEYKNDGTASSLKTRDYKDATDLVLVRQMAVRRLTPVECERLQGFPDNYTLISYRKKPAEQCPDSPRYKALGNSMAVPVMRWIGERIAMVEAIK